MEGDEEGGLESQLELQLEEQKESLSFVVEALSSDPSNAELLSVHEELLLGIRDAEEGLLHLKRSRLLSEADEILARQASEKSATRGVETEPIDPEPLRSEGYVVGSKCRFRHTNGRWYNGRLIAMEGAGSARVSFLNPTSDNMLMCKFFLQQRCRFGSNCRSSHGFSVPLPSLKPYNPTIWQQSLVGSSIWAISDSQTGIWREAELKSWNEKIGMASVVFRGDRSSVELEGEALSQSKYAQMSEDDEEEDNSTPDDSDSLEEGNDSDNETISQGLGFHEATTLPRGVQTETAVFAKWEHHTRGIASKMMASMGYKEGMGLGMTGQGMVNPIPVKVLPPGQSLDHALKSCDTEEKEGSQSKKRSRGGRRKRERKFAEAARAAKAEEEPGPNVFSFINNQLANQNGDDGSRDKMKNSVREDRRSLVAYDDEVKELRSRVGRLEEMVVRNRKDKVVAEAAMRRLNETRKALAGVEAAQASASSAVVQREKEKKWLKF
ncbi:Zinc finger CCCH domain-containing protein 18 [Acorus gramineus]|uniref:Zinc finger CCCH domain-containing protein 18 n=1 Tax=Acorus gramineus TaxID=55184 RepID=A0AAV9BHW0_ACOGR|nr:Zinc finger CCCH domain-containing protein 18 [Acorus gramineus]